MSHGSNDMYIARLHHLPDKLYHGRESGTDKVKKGAKIRNRYNQVLHLTKDTTWESDKTQLNITAESQEDSPFPAGDHNPSRGLSIDAKR